MKTSKKDYRHNTSKISVISPESSTFINIDKMVKQLTKAFSDSDTPKVMRKHSNYLDTKVITNDKVVSLILHGCGLILESFEQTPIQLIENTSATLMVSIMNDLQDELMLGKLTDTIVGYFLYLAEAYCKLYKNLPFGFVSVHGDVIPLLCTYSLIISKYNDLNQAA